MTHHGISARLWLVLAIAAGTLLGNRLLHFDADVGGYRPALGNHATYPKAYVHAVTGFAATLAAGVFTGAPVAALGVVVVAAIVWEFTQGFFNWLDVVAGAVGAGVAVALQLGSR
jgi:hypothetical protein